MNQIEKLINRITSIYYFLNNIFQSVNLNKSCRQAKSIQSKRFYLGKKRFIFQLDYATK